MSGITAGSAARYVEQLKAEADAAIHKLEAELAAASIADQRDVLRARIKEVKAELERKTRAAGHSLF